MIKLKHLLQESTNIELHKVITEKDNPPFMTEEQWLKKWDTNILNESIFENLNEDEIKSIKDIKPQLPLLKRAVAKLLTNKRFLYNPKVQKAFQGYLKTGNLSKQDIADVFQEIRILIGKIITYPALVGLFFVQKYLILAYPIVWTIAYMIGSQKNLVNLFMPKNLTQDEINKAHDKINKKYNVNAKQKALFK